MLAPIWDEAADKIAQEFPEPGKVLIGKIDCDQEGKDLKGNQNISCLNKVWKNKRLF